MQQDEFPSNYASRLANMEQSVVATHDIHNERGLLLVKKGVEINKRRADLLLLHKLTRPIEHSISMGSVLSGSDLYKELSALISRHDDLIELEKQWGLLPKLKPMCQELTQFNILCQKLTVMNEQLQKTFRKSLFVGWFSAGIVSALQRPQQEFKAAFYAGLFHEIGMLHLSPEILHKEGQYSAQEWRNMQAHTVIGAKILALTPKLPKGIVEAVKQHHERADGSGYPAELFCAKQCLLGQVIAVSDSLQAIRFNPKIDRKINLKQLTPVLQVSKDQYSKTVVNVVLQELKKIPVEHLCRKVEEYPMVASNLADILANIQLYAKTLTHIESDIDNMAKEPRLRSLYLSLIHFTATVLQSGVFYEGLKSWLNDFSANLSDEVTADPLELKSIDDMEFLVQEMMFLCNRLQQKAELADKKQLLELKLSTVLITNRHRAA